MRTVLALIRLTAGNVGWYDPLTNIHLTIQKPEAYVYEGMNTKNLRQGVQHKTITVIDGSLFGPSKTVVPTKTVDPIPEPVKQEIKVEVDKKPKAEKEEKKEVVEEKEAPTEEAPKAKKTTRKKKTETEE